MIMIKAVAISFDPAFGFCGGILEPVGANVLTGLVSATTWTNIHENKATKMDSILEVIFILF